MLSCCLPVAVFAGAISEDIRALKAVSGGKTSIAGSAPDASALTLTELATRDGQVLDLSNISAAIRMQTSETAAASLSATSLSFGTPQNVRTKSALQSVPLTSTGNAPLDIASITVTGTGASSFAFANTCGSSVAAGGSCTINGHFTPVTTGAFTATVTITDDAQDSPQSIAVSGTGSSPPAVSLSTASLSFPATTLGTTGTIPVTLTNTGLGNLNVSSISNSGTNPTGFSHTSNCGGTTIVPGGYCTIQVSFTPSAIGSFSAILNIYDNAPEGPQSIAVNGAGVTIPVTLSVATSSSPSIFGSPATFTATISSGPTGTVTFYDGGTSISTGAINGTIATLTTSSLIAGSHSITASWPGNSKYGAATSGTIIQLVNAATPAISWAASAAIIYGTALSSTQLDASTTVAGSFSYSPAAGTVLTAGSHTITATFTPTYPTDYTAATAIVTLTVNQATPVIAWATPPPIVSGTALSSMQLDTSSTVAGTFIYSPAAGTVLAVGSQALSVTFTPTDTTDYTTATASVTLTVNQGTSTLSIDATSVGFGNVALNQPATQTLTLSSTGTSSVTVNSAVLVGAGFTLSGTALPTTLAPGQTATAGVQFDPTVVGAASGTLTISSTSSSNPTATIAITGTGTAVSYAVDLSWDAPVDSTDPVAGYNIYRSLSGSSTYQLLNSSVEGLTAYVDSTVQNGTSYDYIVESVDSSGVESVPTSPVALTIP